MSLPASLHDAARPMVIAVTGGGSRAIARLLTTPGASRSVLEAIVPYSAPAVIDWLGGSPDRFCAEPTARAMAMRAFTRARQLLSAESREGESAIGLAATASLASDRPKRGPHRAHLACQTAEATVAWSVELVKGRRSRSDEEDVVAALLLNLAADAAEVKERVDTGLEADEPTIERRARASPERRALVVGESRVESLDTPAVSGRRAIFPGAFHPRHEGHREMARIAAEILGVPVEHELSIANVDKPPLDYLEIAERAEQFAGEPLHLTRAATFVEKARLFPGATFVVGADTARRIGDPRYYGGQAAARDAALSELTAEGARFLVFGRKCGERYETFDDLALPPPLRALCQGVPEERFRRDLSSTQIRAAADRL